MRLFESLQAQLVLSSKVNQSLTLCENEEYYYDNNNFSPAVKGILEIFVQNKI